MNQHWGFYGLEHQNQPFDFPAIYGNNNPVVLEIGFGMGHSLVDMALQNPERNYLGIEVHTPGVGACIAYAVEKGVKIYVSFAMMPPKFYVIALRTTA